MINYIQMRTLNFKQTKYLINSMQSALKQSACESLVSVRLTNKLKGRIVKLSTIYYIMLFHSINIHVFVYANII